jgi:hypothetical protein
MTYYKYAEREANSQINWAEVSKGLSDTIIQVDKDRQAKKAAIDASTREAMTELANGPKGENTTASAWTINYANDMMNYRLSLDRLLKSGQMKLSDYQVAAQNSVDSTNLVFTLAQEYQDQYKVIMDRSRTLGKNGMPQSSRLEPELAALNESFANISNTVPTINSTNGMVYLSNPEVGEDGVEKLGKNYVSLQALRNRVNSKIDSYSLPNGITEAVTMLGKNTISELGKTNFRRTGVVTDISDPTLRNTYTQWEDATIKKIMASDYQVASILADNMNVNPRTGNQYTATYSKEEFDADKSGDVILMENRNGSGVITPKFKEEQIKDAEAYIKSQMTSYIDKTAEKRPFQEPGVDYAPEYVINRGERTKSSKESGNMLAKLYSGDSAEIQSAVDYFNGLSDVDAVKRTADGVVVTLSNGNTDVIKFKNPDGTLKTQADFIRSASKLLVGDDADLNAVLQGAVGTGKKAFNTTGSASAAVQKNEPTKALSPQQKAKNYISAAITPDMINRTESEAVPLLLASLTKLGFDAEEDDITGSYVKITAPGSKDKAGASKKFSLNDGPEASAKVRQSIIDFVTANLGQEALLNADQAGVLEGIGSKYNK